MEFHNRWIANFSLPDPTPARLQEHDTQTLEV
jgi:hypothetical protein